PETDKLSGEPQRHRGLITPTGHKTRNLVVKGGPLEFLETGEIRNLQRRIEVPLKHARDHWILMTETDNLLFQLGNDLQPPTSTMHRVVRADSRFVHGDPRHRQQYFK